MTQGIFPAAKLVPAPGGILDAATVHEHADSWGKWTNGSFGWLSEACPTTLILADYCTNTGEGIIAESDATPGEGWPFAIITRYDCLTIGMKLEEAKAIALRQNVAGTQKALEWELWTGGAASAADHISTRYLSSSASIDVTPSSGTASVELGVAMLEQALADCGLGTQGTIHMSRSAAQMAVSNRAVRWTQDNKLTTALRTPVIAGVGYDPDVPRATAPPTQAPIPPPSSIGPAPTEQWMYATGPVVVHLGPSEIINIQPMVNIVTNEITVLAGRPAALVYDACCTFAVNVDLEK
jgi:hypothetical protein